MRLTVSIVTYRSDPVLFAGTLHSLSKAIDYAKSRLEALSCGLYIIENEHVEQCNLLQAERFLKESNADVFDEVMVKALGDNLGYGRGHNVALFDTHSDYHLVLNPDVSLEADSIYEGLKYMSDRDGVALVSPGAVDGAGTPLYLCKRFPRIFDLLLRGFGMPWLKRTFQLRLSKYEMHELSGVMGPVEGVDIVSGCCILISTQKFIDVGGFDKSFFLYFEDFDLSLRIGQVGKLVFLPSMKVVHYGGYAAKKGLRHIALFVDSALKFYCRYGWCWY